MLDYPRWLQPQVADVGGSVCCSGGTRAALRWGALALLAPAPAAALLPELLSLDKYAFNNQAVFV